MAERFYGLDRGDTKNDVTEGAASTATTDVEVRIDLAGFPSDASYKSEVLQMLDMIKQYILEDSWPPA